MQHPLPWGQGGTIELYAQTSLGRSLGIPIVHVSLLKNKGGATKDDWLPHHHRSQLLQSEGHVPDSTELRKTAELLPRDAKVCSICSGSAKAILSEVLS